MFIPKSSIVEKVGCKVGCGVHEHHVNEIHVDWEWIISFMLSRSGLIHVEVVWVDVDESDMRLSCEFMEEMRLLASGLSLSIANWARIVVCTNIQVMQFFVWVVSPMSLLLYFV